MEHIALVVVVRDDSSVLMQHRDDIPAIDWPDYWCIPGGRADEGEIPEDAAKRELEEETGYKCSELHALVEEKSTRPNSAVVIWHVYWTPYDGMQPIICCEGQEMVFVSISEFPEKKLIVGQERLMRMAITQASKHYQSM